MTAGINSSFIFSSFLKHLLIVTSLISLTFLISRLLTFNRHICAMKYTTPAAIECGVFSGIKFCFSIFIAIKVHTLVNSWFTFNLLQYRSIKALGLVRPKLVFSLLSISFSKVLIMTCAFLHPFVALVTSR